MSIKKGTTSIGTIYKGLTSIGKVFKGTTLVFQKLDPNFGGLGTDIVGGATLGGKYGKRYVYALYFESANGNTATVSMTNNGGNAPVLEYSSDGSTWTTWNYSALTCPVYIRGTNTSGLSSSTTKYSVFNSTGSVKVSGDVMSLISSSIVTTIPNTYCFYRLFYNNTKIVSTPMYSATTLKKNCYREMFRGCTKLTQAETLSARTLIDSCYYRMFYGCSLLKVQSGATDNIILPSGITTATNALYQMFTSTGGTATGTPTAGTVYGWY